MRIRLYLILFSLLIVLGILARLSLYTVDRNEFAYVTEFGRPIATLDGADGEESGLHVKWPWPIQSVQSFDRRLQYLDLPGAELLTRDPRRETIDKTLTIDAYLCWRIPDKAALDRFIRTVGTMEGARAILAQRINSELGAAIGQMELDDLISVGFGSSLPSLAVSVTGLGAGPNGPLLMAVAVGQLDAVVPDASQLGVHPRVDLKRDYLRKRLLNGDGTSEHPGLKTLALSEYGIEVVDLRLRRLNHPAAVRQAIFERIISEREKKVADYQSEGEQLAANIRSKSERQVSEIRARAEADAIKVRGQADAEADKIRNEAARKDPGFYVFLRKLEDYQRFLGDNKTVLLLSTHREIFDLLFKPPTPEKTNPMGKGDK